MVDHLIRVRGLTGPNVVPGGFSRLDGWEKMPAADRWWRRDGGPLRPRMPCDTLSDIRKTGPGFSTGAGMSPLDDPGGRVGCWRSTVEGAVRNAARDEACRQIGVPFADAFAVREAVDGAFTDALAALDADPGAGFADDIGQFQQWVVRAARNRVIAEAHATRQQILRHARNHLMRRAGPRRARGADPDLDDVVQEALVRLSTHQPPLAFPGRQPFWRWLNTTTERLVIDLLRRRVIQPDENAPEPESRPNRGEPFDVFWSGFDRLPPFDRRVVFHTLPGDDRMTHDRLGQVLAGLNAEGVLGWLDRLERPALRPVPAAAAAAVPARAAQFRDRSGTDAGTRARVRAELACYHGLGLTGPAQVALQGSAGDPDRLGDDLVRWVWEVCGPGSKDEFPSGIDRHRAAARLRELAHGHRGRFDPARAAACEALAAVISPDHPDAWAAYRWFRPHQEAARATADLVLAAAADAGCDPDDLAAFARFVGAARLAPRAADAARAEAHRGHFDLLLFLVTDQPRDPRGGRNSPAGSYRVEVYDADAEPLMAELPARPNRSLAARNKVARGLWQDIEYRLRTWFDEQDGPPGLWAARPLAPDEGE
jgi:DNA-directed RNA polymerase specialized sigma24 family protein